MKKALIIFLLISVTGISNAQQVENNTKRELPKKGFFGIGISYLLMSPKIQDNMHFVGVGMTGGFYVTPKSSLGFEVRFHGQVNEGEQVGAFEYTSQTGSGPITRHSDGVITRTYSSIPILATWAYEMNLSEKAYIYVGPTIGVNILSGRNKYEPAITEGDAPENKKNKATFCYGGNIGLSIEIDNMTSFNIGYKCLGNSDISLYHEKYNMVGHHIYVNINLNF